MDEQYTIILTVPVWVWLLLIAALFTDAILSAVSAWTNIRLRKLRGSGSQ